MYIGSITTFAWLVKPAIGYIIDNFLNKKVWIFISLALDILIVLLLGLVWLPIVFLVSMLIFNSTNAAFRDVAVDGIMCVEGKKAAATGKIQSVQWISISVAGVLTGVGGGYVADKWGYQAAFLMLIPVYLIVGLTAFFYRPAEGEQIESSANLISDMKRLFSHKHLIVVGLFVFLYRFSPSIGTPLFFIQRDNFGWSKVWIGWLATISTIFGIVGSLVYYRYSKEINIKKWLFWSVFVGAITTLSYLYYTPVSAVAYDIIYSLIGMFIFLMTMDFMARNSVKGLEATSFALLCSFSNLALVASNLSGAILLPKIGLNWLIIISALTSFFCLPLINKIEDNPSNLALEA